MPDKTWVAGDVVTAADTNLYLNHTGGAWNTWTPVITQPGTVTATVNHAVWYRAGRLIIASFRLTVTGAGTGSNTVTVSLPVTAARSQGPAGYGIIFDASATLSYTGEADLATTSTMSFSGHGLGVSPNALGSTGSAFTAALAVGDVVTGSLTYEAAS